MYTCTVELICFQKIYQFHYDIIKVKTIKI